MKTFRNIQAATAVILVLAINAQAQVITDGTLGAIKTLQGPNYSIPGTIGQIAGTNLFHSFSQFNINNGESATFSGPTTIQNIISRVTGGQLSTIDGLLKSTINGANLYLINPSGIMFGPNATLDISGSFYATTADYLKLGATGRFDATTPANTVLTVDEPSAFGFLGANPSPISIDRSHLAVPEGKTLSIIGGDIAITNDADTTILSAPGGRINLASVASIGELTLAPTGINASAFSKMGTISVSNTGTHDPYTSPGDIAATTVEAATGSGSIYISGGKFILDNGWIFSYTPGHIDGKGIFIEARDGAEIKNGSWICTDTYATGNAGSILVNTGSLSLSTSRISAGSKGSGNSGDITVRASTVDLKDSSEIRSRTTGSGHGGSVFINSEGTVAVTGSSEISADSFYGTGNAGSVFVNAKVLTVDDKGGLSASSALSSSGNAGTVSVTADEVSLAGSGALLATSLDSAKETGKIYIVADKLTMDKGQIVTETSSGTGGIISINASEILMQNVSSIRSNLHLNGTGTAGDISIITNHLEMHDSSSIVSNTYGSGHGGNITINGGGNVSVEKLSSIFSETWGSGNAGKISMDIGGLEMSGGFVSSSAKYSSGNASDIFITVAGPVKLSSYGYITSSSSSSGNAGNVTIDSKSLTVESGSSVSTDADYFSKGKAGGIGIHTEDAVTISGAMSQIASTTWGTSQAGNISLSAGSVSLSRGGNISTSTYGAGDGGLISIRTAGDLNIAGKETYTPVTGLPVTYTSSVTSNTLRKGGGGTISVDAGKISVSDGGVISAAALKGSSGKGGDIVVKASVLLSITGGKNTTGIFSDSSGSGLAGSVSITTPSLTITDSGKISAESTSTGKAGDLVINVSDKISMNGGSITTATTNADGGNITIDPVMMDLRNSSITTSVNGGTGNGGNISIAAGTLLLDHSKIIAKAVGGNGGNISINADVFLYDPLSLVSASSQLGLPGRIGINAPLVDLSGNLVTLPEGILGANELTPRQCTTAGETSSSFVVDTVKLQSQPDRNLLAY
ncbi:MAG: filamentous hemagglutinin N-terminal domain-containing protein [Pedobacter sp.]